MIVVINTRLRNWEITELAETHNSNSKHVRDGVSLVYLC